MEVNNPKDRFDSRKRLVLPIFFFHSFQERTTSILRLAQQFMDKDAAEKFYFAYRIQTNQIYLREALTNSLFHRKLVFEQDDRVSTDHVMSFADRLDFLLNAVKAADESNIR